MEQMKHTAKCLHSGTLLVKCRFLATRNWKIKGEELLAIQLTIHHLIYTTGVCVCILGSGSFTTCAEKKTDYICTCLHSNTQRAALYRVTAAELTSFNEHIALHVSLLLWNLHSWNANHSSHSLTRFYKCQTCCKENRRAFLYNASCRHKQTLVNSSTLLPHVKTCQPVWPEYWIRHEQQHILTERCNSVNIFFFFFKRGIFLTTNLNRKCLWLNSEHRTTHQDLYHDPASSSTRALMLHVNVG